MCIFLTLKTIARLFVIQLVFCVFLCVCYLLVVSSLSVRLPLSSEMLKLYSLTWSSVIKWTWWKLEHWADATDEWSGDRWRYKITRDGSAQELSWTISHAWRDADFQTHIWFCDSVNRVEFGVDFMMRCRRRVTTTGWQRHRVLLLAATLLIDIGIVSSWEWCAFPDCIRPPQHGWHTSLLRACLFAAFRLWFQRKIRYKTYWPW